MRLAVNFSEPNRRTLNFEFLPSFFSPAVLPAPFRPAPPVRSCIIERLVRSSRRLRIIIVITLPYAGSLVYTYGYPV